jgi:hypothetical protein
MGKGKSTGACFSGNEIWEMTDHLDVSTKMEA